MRRMDTLGSRIAQARAKGKCTKMALAIRLGVDLRTIYRWESGATSPGSEYAVPLADALGVDVRWLLTGETEAA